MMKCVLCFAAILSCGGLVHAIAPSDFKITGVTVYPEGAVITRVGAADLPAGDREVVFENLPRDLIRESLQVSGRGESPVTILDVVAREQHLDAAPNARIRAIEDEEADLQRQRHAITDRSANLDRKSVV